MKLEFVIGLGVEARLPIYKVSRYAECATPEPQPAAGHSESVPECMEVERERERERDLERERERQRERES